MRPTIFAAVIVCLTHALLSYPGYEPVPATTAIDTLPLPADCPNGQCPVRMPVLRQAARNVAAKPVDFVVENKPVRTVAAVPVRAMQAQPLRTALRRVFCR